jgi:hypothetical protein
MIGFEILQVSERVFSASMRSVRTGVALYNETVIDGSVMPERKPQFMKESAGK